MEFATIFKIAIPSGFLLFALIFSLMYFGNKNFKPIIDKIRPILMRRSYKHDLKRIQFVSDYLIEAKEKNIPEQEVIQNLLNNGINGDMITKAQIKNIGGIVNVRETNKFPELKKRKTIDTETAGRPDTTKDPSVKGLRKIQDRTSGYPLRPGGSKKGRKQHFT